MNPGKTPRRLQDIENDLERGVFLAVYQSPQQRRKRTFAVLLLILKHSLRGILFSWPLYLLALATLLMPWGSLWLFLLLCVPAIRVSWGILSRGIREDHVRFVEGLLMSEGYLKEILIPKDPRYF